MEFKEIYPWEDRLQYRFASAYQVEINCRIGKIKEAEVWAEPFRGKTYDQIRFMDFFFYDVLAQVLIELNQLDEAQDLLEVLLGTSKQAEAAQLEAQTLGRLSIVPTRWAIQMQRSLCWNVRSSLQCLKVISALLLTKGMIWLN